MTAPILTGQNPIYSSKSPSRKPSEPLQTVASKLVASKCKSLTMQIRFPCLLGWLSSQYAHSPWNPRSHGFSSLKYSPSTRSENSWQQCHLLQSTPQLPLQLSKFLQDLLITRRKFCLWIHKHETNGIHLHLAIGWTWPSVRVTFNLVQAD